MNGMKPPEPLTMTGNLPENWRTCKWRQRFQLYLIASGMIEKPANVRCATLLHVIGVEALEVYNTFRFEEGEDNNDLDTLLKKYMYTEYFEPQRNVTYARHLFNTRSQQPEETIDQFATDLKLQAKNCEFGTLTESLIKDRLVVGISDDATRARLLRERKLTLQRALEICRAAQSSKTQMGKITASAEQNASAYSDKAVHTLKPGKGKHQSTKPGHSQSRHKQFGKACKYCGTWHDAGKCPAYGKNCSKCGKNNHFASVCMSRTTEKAKSKTRPRKVHNLEESDDSDSDFFVNAV